MRRKDTNPNLNLSRIKKQVDLLLQKFFRQEISQCPHNLPESRLMFQRIANFCLSGGKRLRPSLFLYGYALFKKRLNQDIYQASLITELIHAFFLIHDDIMDKGLLRHSKPTIHELYANIPGVKKSGHYGNAMAILAGDLALTLALKILTLVKLSERAKNQFLNLIVRTLETTIHGQILDMKMEERRSASIAEVLTMYRNKTAYYSFSSPLILGATLAGASKKEIKKLQAYALPCGIAFQIKDDILGLFGDEKKTGKSAKSDLQEGKQTLLIAMARKNGTGRDQEVLRILFSKKKITARDIGLVQKIIETTRAREYDGTFRRSFLIGPNGKIKKIYEKVNPVTHAEEVIRDFVSLP